MHSWKILVCVQVSQGRNKSHKMKDFFMSPSQHLLLFLKSPVHEKQKSEFVTYRNQEKFPLKQVSLFQDSIAPWWVFLQTGWEAHAEIPIKSILYFLHVLLCDWVYQCSEKDNIISCASSSREDPSVLMSQLAARSCKAVVLLAAEQMDADFQIWIIALSARFNRQNKAAEQAQPILDIKKCI